MKTLTNTYHCPICEAKTLVFMDTANRSIALSFEPGCRHYDSKGRYVGDPALERSVVLWASERAGLEIVL